MYRSTIASRCRFGKPVNRALQVEALDQQYLSVHISWIAYRRLAPADLIDGQVPGYSPRPMLGDSQ